MKNGKLNGKVAVVTGASKGIGAGIAKELAAEGASVVVNYASAKSDADKVVDEITKRGGKAVAAQANVAKKPDVERLFAETEKALGKIDILVNNAGLTRDNILLRLTDADWDAVLDANLKGAFHTTRAVIKGMMKRRAGRIVNITSIVGLTGNKGQANYAASKAGLIGFTKSVAKEYASRGILVNCVAPGFIETDMTAALPDEARATLLQDIALGRLGRPEDVAGAVLFLASDLAAYVTGQVLVVDGGMVI